MPPELEARRDWLQLRDLVAACVDDGDRRELRRREQRAWLRYRLAMDRSGASPAWVDYRDELVRALGPGTASTPGDEAREPT